MRDSLRLQERWYSCLDAGVALASATTMDGPLMSRLDWTLSVVLILLFH